MQPDDILNLPFSKIILSNKIDKSFAYNKAVIVPIQWRNKQIWQMTLYTDKQAFQENLKTLSELKKTHTRTFSNQI